MKITCEVTCENYVVQKTTLQFTAYAIVWLVLGSKQVKINRKITGWILYGSFSFILFVTRFKEYKNVLLLGNSIAYEHKALSDLKF